ncbi:RasGTPase-activating protein [Pelomyxa schiedti]|nr:RasGTPase-activating protein [Pelomyxa schiedti]
MHRKPKISKEQRAAFKLALLQGPELATALTSPSSLVSKEAVQRNSEAVTSVYMACGVGSQLVKGAIISEIQSSVQVETMFRINSLATRIMNVYYKRVGKEYLKHCLGPFFSVVTSKDFNLPLSGHITSLIAPEGVDLNASVAKLVCIMQDLFDRIFSSKEMCPMLLRQIFNFVFTEVGKKAPHLKLLSVGGFLFLRFICPAVLGPEVFGILPDKPSDSASKVIILCSSILQKIANACEFSNPSQNEQLGMINKLISRNLPTLLSFLEQIATVTLPLPDSGPPIVDPEENIEEILNHLFQQTTKSLDLIVEFLKQNFPQYDPQNISSIVSSSSRKSEAKISGKPVVIDFQPTHCGDEATTNLADDCNISLLKANSLRRDFSRGFEEYCDLLHAYAEQESVARRAAEAENRLLRMKIKQLEQHALLTSSPPMDISLFEADPTQYITQELDETKKRFVKIMDRLLQRISEMHVKISESENISEVVFLGKIAREMHTMVQTPIKCDSKVKQIPFVNIQSNPDLWDRVNVLRKASLQALHEVRSDIEKISENMPFIFQMYDLDRRLVDLFKMAKQSDTIAQASSASSTSLTQTQQLQPPQAIQQQPQLQSQVHPQPQQQQQQLAPHPHPQPQTSLPTSLTPTPASSSSPSPSPPLISSTSSSPSSPSSTTPSHFPVLGLSPPPSSPAPQPALSSLSTSTSHPSQQQQQPKTTPVAASTAQQRPQPLQPHSSLATSPTSTSTPGAKHPYSSFTLPSPHPPHHTTVNTATPHTSNAPPVALPENTPPPPPLESSSSSWTRGARTSS